MGGNHELVLFSIIDVLLIEHSTVSESGGEEVGGGPANAGEGLLLGLGAISLLRIRNPHLVRDCGK